ncbi:zinc finger protein 41-like [Diorhabda carinulata]|uniref:zinc finger protein 41-like n=1 Tax=Diorhabda carinulata TaxID=1163345 RepID=UPI0025A1D08C|nr:zinc finger protein 41-like [Diorhabda carinulata]
MPKKRSDTQEQMSRDIRRVNNLTKNICTEKSDNNIVDIKKENIDNLGTISNQTTKRKIKDKTTKDKQSVKKDRNVNTLKFDPVIIKVNDKEVMSIPEYPDIRLKVVKGGKHPYMCPKCNAGFWTKSAYKAHSPIHVLKKTKQPVKKFRCDICAKEFSKLCDVERHTRVHTGEKPCICNICNKRFQVLHNLNKHLLTHVHIKPFYCEICNKQFSRNDILRRHLLTHSVDKPFKCSVCLRGFIRHEQLLQHMKQKHFSIPVDLREQFVSEKDLSNSNLSVVEIKEGIKIEV